MGLMGALSRTICSIIAWLLVGAGPAGAGLLPRDDVPLRTQGRYIISRSGERVKWACVNWYGAYSETSVVGGLEVRPLREIVSRIVDLKFNCVRLCYSTQAHVENPVVQDADVAANPQFRGARFLDVWDATVQALTDVGLMVIINNQVHKSGWCCHYTQEEGLWYVDGYPESLWIESLVGMTVRHRNNSLVVAIDLRNEVHDYQDTVLTWGDGDPKTDWAAAATRAGNAVLAANPNVLIVVMALCFGMELRPAREHPIRLALPDRVVYQTHNYLEYQVWHLVSQSFASWTDLRLATGLLLILPVVILWGLRHGWNRLGRPRPKWNVLVIHSGIWLSVLSLITVAICKAFLVLLSKNPGCGYWGRRDVVPTLACAATLSGVAALAAVAGYAHLRRSRQHAHVADAVPNGVLPNGQGHPAENGASHASNGQRPVAVHTEESEDVEEDEEETSRGPGFGAGLVPPGRCCARGCGSVALARSLAFGQACGAEAVAWDCGLCCALQCCSCCALALAALLSLFLFTFAATSYGLLEQHFDRSWGYLLQDSRLYTAPVWMGEFGNSVSGQYWLDLMQYLNKRDVDYAYWAINGRKYATGYIDITNGQWVGYDSPRWLNESFGVLDEDYWTVRSAWRLLDLQMLASSPAQWRPQGEACDRKEWGGACGF